jgi:Ca-activated chloride channel family protein
MSFAAPLNLLALLAAPLLAALWAYERGRRRRFAVRHPAAAMVAGAAGRVPRWRRLVSPLLLMLAATAMAVALARPQATMAVPVERASVMLVTDESGSMLAGDVDPAACARRRRLPRRSSIVCPTS